MNKIDPIDLKAVMATHDEWALFDVRELGEAEQGHILGATFLPRRMIEFRISELVPARSTAIIIYDDGGDRAALAARTLVTHGYHNVSVLNGGIAAWEKVGFALVQGSNVPSKIFGEHVCKSSATPSVSAEELCALQKSRSGILLCDIRTPEEYEKSGIPGAFGTPGFDVALIASDLVQRNTPIVVHCAGRTRSIIACETLRRLGIPSVSTLENGTMGWVLFGRELRKGPSADRLVASARSRQAIRLLAKNLANAAEVKSASSTELLTWLQSRDRSELNLYVFDVRQLSEYITGHIEGALALPGGQAIQRADEFVPVRAGRVVLVDDDEARAYITAYWFRQMGFDDVQILSGGINSWIEAGLPLTCGRKRKPPLGLENATTLVTPVSAAQLAEVLLVNPNTVVLDVDTSRRYSEGHLIDAVWIPRGRLETCVEEVVPQHDASIVVTCHDGLHSTLAGGTLRQLGYENVYVLSGGKQNAGQLAMETGMSETRYKIDDVILPPFARGASGMRRYLEWETHLVEDSKTKV